LWSGRLAAALFSILATLRLWQINPRLWLNWYLQSCAEAGGQAPPDIEPFLPWNLSEDRRAKLRMEMPTPQPDTS
jgi:transposase